jgi:hypothetical protein
LASKRLTKTETVTFSNKFWWEWVNLSHTILRDFKTKRNYKCDKSHGEIYIHIYIYIYMYVFYLVVYFCSTGVWTWGQPYPFCVMGIF